MRWHESRYWIAAAVALLLCACSSGKAAQKDAGTAHAGSPALGTGGAGRAVPGGTGGRSGSVQHGCGEGPDDVSVACDAGVDAGAGAPATKPDAGRPQQQQPDAARPFDAGLDAGSPPPTTPDEGLCATRQRQCESESGHAETSTGSAVCTITGDALQIDHEVCEVCGKSTDTYDFSVVVMDCNGCTQVYREGNPAFGTTFAANTCGMRSEFAGLTLTESDPQCIDVYAYVGSGVGDAFGWTLHSSDQVRVCRCDRTTDTCTTCANGACDE